MDTRGNITFHADDYPKTALRDGAEGRVAVRFDVDGRDG